MSAVTLTACDGTEERWSDGELRGRWRVVYTGHGEVSGDDRELFLAPAPAERESVTHAALVVTEETYLEADFEVSVRTERQLREPEPNEWEVGWVLWNYTSPTRFYSVALKPNGWEVAKQDPAYPGAQRFLRTGTEPRFPVGRTYRVGVTQSDGVITVSADGRTLTTFQDDERPYRGGAVGLYTEDAAVRFTDLLIDDRDGA
jgi:hypothetical protein